MRTEGLHRTHLEILGIIQEEEVTISRIGDRINKSMSWTSECVDQLVFLDLAQKRKQGLEVFVRPASNELSEGLESLMKESPMIDLSKVLGKAGLRILPALLDPGATVKEVGHWTGLSIPTIRRWIQQWRGMGVVIKVRRKNRYRIPKHHKALRGFIVRYSQWSNRRMLDSAIPHAIIVWQWRQEFLFSLEERVDYPDYMSAGPTRLEELGYDILHTREYYLHSPDTHMVSEEEALVQALMINRNNPRIMRFINEGIRDRGASHERILEFAGKYGLRTVLSKAVG